MGFYYVGQASLECLASRDPLTLASQSAGITGMSLYTWPLLLTLNVVIYKFTHLSDSIFLYRKQMMPLPGFERRDTFFFFLIFYWILGFGVHEQSMQDSCVGTHMAVCYSFLLPFTHIWHFSPGYPSPPPPPTDTPLFPPIDPSV